MPRAIQLGRYHLLDRIAFGGMAEIYRAQTFDEAGMPFIVAIKRVLRHLVEDDDFLRMLVDEARIASMLQSKNIAKVYEFGHVGRDYFISMEFVGGKDVRSIMERCRAENRWVPPEICVFVIKETMMGLHAAHELKDSENKHLNLIHRDVSPSNIICAYNGNVKLCDFGIAKATLSRVKTRAGVIKGKVKYMSPEQALGRKLDRRSDIFSAGSVLYEMLTRIPPFLAPNEMELILKVRDAKYVPVRERNPTIPPALELIVDTAMSRSRSGRYETALEFAGKLQDFLDNHAKGFRSSHLSRFLKSLFRRDMDEEEKALKEYEVIEVDETNLGENLIADSMDPQAPWSRFSPVPTSSYEISHLKEALGKKAYQGLKSEPDMPAGMEPPPNERSVSGFINFESKNPEDRAKELLKLAESVQVGDLEAILEQKNKSPKPACNEECPRVDEDFQHEQNAHPAGNEGLDPPEDLHSEETGPDKPFEENQSSDRFRIPVDHEAETVLLELDPSLICAPDDNSSQKEEPEPVHEPELEGETSEASLHDRPTQILDLDMGYFQEDMVGKLTPDQEEGSIEYGKNQEAYPPPPPPPPPPSEDNRSYAEKAHFGPERPTPVTMEDEILEASPDQIEESNQISISRPPPFPPPPPDAEDQKNKPGELYDSSIQQGGNPNKSRLTKEADPAKSFFGTPSNSSSEIASPARLHGSCAGQPSVTSPGYPTPTYPEHPGYRTPTRRDHSEYGTSEEPDHPPPPALPGDEARSTDSGEKDCPPKNNPWTKND